MPIVTAAQRLLATGTAAPALDMIVTDARRIDANRHRRRP